jgi:pyruvate formate lyase activating enzyme
MLPPIRGFIESTLIDWEGKIASGIFLPGCNFRCPFCHAGHLVTHPDALESIPLDAVTGYIDRQKGWIEGVVIGGGEPTLHDGLPELIAELRRHGVAIKLDTNGTRPDMLERLLADGLVEMVSMDVKAPFDERYNLATAAAVDVDAVRRSTELLIAAAVDVEFRTTVCPAFLDFEDLREIAAAIRGAPVYVLQEFRPGDCLDPAMNEVKPYPRETLREWAEQLDSFVHRCIVRGDWAGGAG